jgi:hypothetical protein
VDWYDKCSRGGDMVKKILLDAFKIIFTLLTVENVVGKNRLSEHISDFQYVAYSKEDVRDQHTRHKRSEPQDNHEVAETSKRPFSLS